MAKLSVTIHMNIIIINIVTIHVLGMIINPVIVLSQVCMVDYEMT
jgi:hypothetical protein